LLGNDQLLHFGLEVTDGRVPAVHICCQLAPPECLRAASNCH
jgi:hypothetical protein